MNISKLYRGFEESLGAGPFYTTWSMTGLHDTINAPRRSSCGIRLLEDVSNLKGPVSLPSMWRQSSESLAFLWSRKQQQCQHFRDNIRTESPLTLVSSMKIISLLSSLRNFTTFSQSSMNSAGAALGVKKGDKREQSLLFFRMV